MLSYYKKVRKQHFEGYPLEYLYFVPVQKGVHSSVPASASRYFQRRPCGPPAAGRETTEILPQKMPPLAAPSSEWGEGLVPLCFEALVMLVRFAGLGLAGAQPPQSADEPQDSRNIPQKWSQPKKVQHLVCCTRVRTYHLSVEVSEHFPLQMSPHPERHPLPSGRFFFCIIAGRIRLIRLPVRRLFRFAPDKVSLHLLLSGIHHRLILPLPCLDFRQWHRPPIRTDRRTDLPRDGWS